MVSKHAPQRAYGSVHSRIDASNAISTSIFPEEVIVDMQPASLLHALNVFYRQEEAVLD